MAFFGWWGLSACHLTRSEGRGHEMNLIRFRFQCTLRRSQVRRAQSLEASQSVAVYFTSNVAVLQYFNSRSLYL
jgi:hypothetical protein